MKGILRFAYGLVAIWLILYTVLVKPKRFRQCLIAPLRCFLSNCADDQRADLPPPEPGNRVQLLVNGDEALPAMLAMLSNARKTIRWQVMLFSPDEIGRQLADALIAAARRGVTVQLSFDIPQTVNGSIAEPLPAEMKRQQTRAMQTLLSQLRAAGVEVRANPGGLDFPLHDVPLQARVVQEEIQRHTCLSANHYDHRKLLIVDGITAWMGGMNIGKHYQYHLAPALRQDMLTEARQRRAVNAPEAWEKWFDASVVLEGPVAADLSAEFDWKWQVLGGAALPGAALPEPVADGGVPVQFLRQRPGLPQVGARFFELVSTARSEIYVASPFISYDPALEALQAAVRRGVRVVFVYPHRYLEGSVSGQVFGSRVRGLLEAGVELYFNDLRMAHTKLMVVDGQWVLLGSFNLNHRSFRHDLEIAALVDDRDFAGQVIGRVFGPYLQISRRVSLPYHAPWNPLNRLLTPFT